MWLGLRFLLGTYVFLWVKTLNGPSDTQEKGTFGLFSIQESTLPLVTPSNTIKIGSERQLGQVLIWVNVTPKGRKYQRYVVNLHRKCADAPYGTLCS